MKAYPFHERRPLVAVTAAYGLGIGMGLLLPWRPIVLAAGLLCAVLTLPLCHAAGKSRAWGCMAVFLFFGMLRCGFAVHPALPPPGTYRAEATAAADFRVREDGKAAGYLENAEMTAGDGSRVFLRRVYWTYEPDAETPFLPAEGERVAFSGFLYHPNGQVNPHGFDFRLFLLTKGVPVGISGADEPERLSAPGRGLFSVFYRARKGLEEKLREIFGEDAALPSALLLGMREELPEETYVSFQKAGAAHILSVSGLHVGLLAGALIGLLKRRLGPKPRLIVLGAFLAAYCALLEFSAPVVRASLLVMLYQLRHVLRRASDDLTLLAAAFLTILLVSPLMLFTASFVLSFCAVLGLCLWRRFFENRLSFLRVRWLRRNTAASLAATLGTLLPAVWYFHQFSLIGLLLNPFLCALFQLLLPAYALILLLGCLWLPLGQTLAYPLCWAARGVTAAVRAAGSLPLATLRLPRPPWYCLLLTVIGLLLACRFCALPKKRRFRLGGASVLLALLLWVGLLPRGVQYIQLAMGQADAAILTDGAFTTVVDTGNYGGDVASYLLSTGRKADRLVLTHLHSDHCMGLQELMEQEVPIGEILLPEGAEECAVAEDVRALLARARQKGIPFRSLSAGDVLETPRTRMTVLWPQHGRVEPGMEANRYPLVTLTDLDGVKLLSASDLEGRYEKYAAADADILKVAHHGSRSSTGAAFLSGVTPRYALITGSGRGLPDEETLSRLADAGVLVYNTFDTGAITLTVRSGEGRFRAFLKTGL